MTTAEKIRAIEKSGWPLAYDGCHKIYFLQDEAQIARAKEYGYDLFDAEELCDLILRSCPLVFVSRWGLSHPWNISQSEQDIFTAAEGEQLNKIAEQEHILPATRETLISSYSPAQQAIAQVLTVSKNITDGEDPEQRKQARAYRLKIKASRTSVEATRKDLKTEALRYGKAVDGMANVIKFIAQQEEERLEQIEKHEELKEQARKNALAADRREQLTALGAPESTLDLGSMPDADWELILNGARLAKQRREEDQRKAEEARVAQAKAEAEERERLRKEAEEAKAKLATEREALAKAQAEAAAKAKAEAEAKAKVQAERLQSVRAIDPKANVTGIDFAGMSSEHFQEFLSKTEKNRKDREKLEATQAKAKELEKQRKAEEEAKAKAPDKEKLQQYFDALIAVPVPLLKTPAAVELCDLFCEQLVDIVRVYEKKLEQQ